MDYVGIAIAALMVVLLVSKILQVFRIVVWRPYALTKSFKKQGIAGPPYSLLRGSLDEQNRGKKAAREIVLDTNSNDIVQRVLPHFYKWSLEYGETFLYWEGTQPYVYISDPELAKQILSNKFGFYIKPRGRRSLEIFTGKGLARLNGPDWVRHRRTINPAFSLEKLKVMVNKMATCTKSVLEEWKSRATTAEEQCKKIEMIQEFQKLTADIIAHTAFGSSYNHGKEAFQAQKLLQHFVIASYSNILIAGSQYLPTPSNLQIWKLDRKKKSKLRGIIESRLSSKATSNSESPYGDDLVGLTIANSETTERDGSKLTMDEIMEEYKTFFFTGHDTIANLLIWTVFLLSSHQEWQAKLREEVLRECGMKIPDADLLAKLKFVNMFLLEVLRLYCPVVLTIREAPEDMKLGNLMVPKHTCLTIPILIIHHSKKYWGEDAKEFNPLRFKDGISKAAKHPNAFLAFAIGPRACIGQNFAMLEAKTVISLILQRFSLSLSPEYKHTPINNLFLQPQSGLPVIMKPLEV